MLTAGEATTVQVNAFEGSSCFLLLVGLLAIPAVIAVIVWFRRRGSEPPAEGHDPSRSSPPTSPPSDNIMRAKKSRRPAITLAVILVGVLALVVYVLFTDPPTPTITFVNSSGEPIRDLVIVPAQGSEEVFVRDVLEPGASMTVPISYDSDGDCVVEATLDNGKRVRKVVAYTEGATEETIVQIHAGGRLGFADDLPTFEQ